MNFSNGSLPNTWIYYPNPFPQITRFLLADARNSSKTNPCIGGKRQKGDGNGES